MFQLSSFIDNVAISGWRIFLFTIAIHHVIYLHIQHTPLQRCKIIDFVNALDAGRRMGGNGRS